MLIVFILGGIVVAYWRDKKFRGWVNSKLGKKPQKRPTEKDIKDFEAQKEDRKDEKHPNI